MEKPNLLSKLALQRLQRDFKELQECPLSNVVALPNEKNFFEWHVVCKGVPGSLTEGKLFHFTLAFPQNYPEYGPKDTSVRVLFMRTFRCWVSSFSILSILLTLQSIISDEKINDFQEVKSISCGKECPFSKMKESDIFLTESQIVENTKIVLAKEDIKKKLLFSNYHMKKQSVQENAPKQEEKKVPTKEKKNPEVPKEDGWETVTKKAPASKSWSSLLKIETPVKEEKKEEKIEKKEKETIEIDIEAKEAAFEREALIASVFDLLSDELLLHLFSFLKFSELRKAQQVCHYFNRVSNDGVLWKTFFEESFGELKKNLTPKSMQDWKYLVLFAHQKKILDEIQCFHNKTSFQEDILGIPLRLYKKDNTETSLVSDAAYITATPYFLSRTAFHDQGVRKTPESSFTNWLPVFINEEHGKKALPLLKNKGGFQPMMVVEVLPKILNSMIVAMLTESENDSNIGYAPGKSMKHSLATSPRVLRVYCLIHRLLLWFVKLYPELRIFVNNKITSFTKNENQRSKEMVPNLGEMIALFAVCDAVPFWAFSKAYLSECFDRNARWILYEYPKLAVIREKENRTERLNLSFQANATSLKLYLFHIYFINKIARPPGVSLSQVASSYDKLLGLPPKKMEDSLYNWCVTIQSLQGWRQFFQFAGIPMTEEKLADWLKTAIQNSEKKKYHDQSILTLKKKHEQKKEKEKENYKLYSLTGCPYCDGYWDDL